MQVGDVIDGKYRLARQLRSGGMGAVYVADRIALGDQVALKVVLPTQNNDVARARFFREAQAVARIRHPNVIQIFDFGETGPQTPYFVMELLDGPTLDDELRAKKRLTPERAVEVFRPICAAVEAGHRRGVLHRDLKPGNVMLPRMDDGRELVKVLDFGLAVFTEEADTERLTVSGAMVGTYTYMSPEQVLSEDVGPQSDVFSLGIMLYEMVTGRVPFTGGSSFAIMDRIVAGRYKSPLEFVADLPDNVVGTITAALQREPSARPRSPAELIAILDGTQGSDTENEVALADDEGTPVTDGEGVAPLTQITVAPIPDPSRVNNGVELPQLTCFVGRGTELETLKSDYNDVLQGKGRVTVVVGDTGVGKTTLLQQFGAWAKQRGACVVTGRFFDYEGDRPAPFQTFLAMLASANEPSNASHVTSAEQRAEDRIVRLIGGTTTRGEGGLPDDHDKWRVFAAIADEFERIASERPLVLIFDDLQWASHMHLELLGYLGRNLGSGRTFIAGTARDIDTQRNSGSDLSQWLLGQGGLRACSLLPIQPFGALEIRAWLDTVFGGLAIRPHDLERLEDATGGNPYYLYEVTRHLLATGRIGRQDGAWTCGELDRVALPATVSNAVQAKLTNVDERLRTVLEAAAVIGDQFRFETLLEATGRDEDELEELLEAAVLQQLISEDGVTRPDDFRFYSGTIRRVLYDDMPARRRRRMHQKVVRALELVYSARLDRIARALGYHYHAIEDWNDGLRWSVQAGEEAIARADMDAAKVTLDRARDAIDNIQAEGKPLPVDDAMRLELLVGTRLLRVGRPEEAKQHLATAAELARKHDAVPVRADALLEFAQCHVARGDLEKAVAVAEDAARVAGAGGDRTRALSARIVAGNVLRRLGRTVDAEERFDAIVGMLSDDESPSLKSLVYQNLAWIRTQRGAFQEGGEFAHRAHALAREARDPIAEQQACSTMAFWFDETGDHGAAIRWHEDSLKLSRSLSLRRREGIDLANIGETYYKSGDYERARGNFEQGLGIFVEIGDRACEGDCRVNLGRTLLDAGDVEAALSMLSIGLSICERTGRQEYAAIALYSIGSAKLDSGDRAGALEALTRSREIYAALGWHDLSRVDEALARLEAKG